MRTLLVNNVERDQDDCTDKNHDGSTKNLCDPHELSDLRKGIV